jgi:hypothetical protein
MGGGYVGRVVGVRGLWVARLDCSARTAHKVATVHGVNADEVLDAVVATPGLRYVWHHHPERGVRAIVEVELRGRAHLVVLYPSEQEDHFRLGSAYPT